ncbi:MAG: nucleoside triphosphate pyrophosphohydrolase [Bdellovibrionota bacterium]|nr:nucleoside triphosphate pyrophosphohydrolase [Bdellovibrionota bacterium]
MEKYLEEIREFEAVVSALRKPETGCPWDLQQDLNSLTKFMSEESSEYISAVASGNPEEMKDELGDVLLQVFLNAKIAEQDGLFSLEDVVKNIKEKMIRRHPHVFSDTKLNNSEEVKENWEKIKQTEKKKTPVEKLFSIPKSLPGLLEASEIGKKVAKLNFEWPTARSILSKLHEEVGEVIEELDAVSSEDEFARDAEAFRKMEHEIGDLLFVVSQFSRKLNINPELAVKKCNERFYKRFSHVAEQVTQSGKDFYDFSEEEMEAFWRQAKSIEKAKLSST